MKRSKKLKYEVDISWSEEDQVYVVRIPELPGCVTHGETLEEAAKMAQEAMSLHLETLREIGAEIPKPLAEQHFSGKIPLRIDPILHRDLVIKARAEGEKSLNKFVEKTLKKAI